MVTPLVKHKIVKKRTAPFKRYQSDRKVTVKVRSVCDWRPPRRRPSRRSPITNSARQRTVASERGDACGNVDDGSCASARSVAVVVARLRRARPFAISRVPPSGGCFPSSRAGAALTLVSPLSRFPFTGVVEEAPGYRRPLPQEVQGPSPPPLRRLRVQQEDPPPPPQRFPQVRRAQRRRP